MAIVTEIGQFRLIPGVDPTDAQSDAAQHLQKVFDTLSEQKGFIRGYWGVQDEDTSTMVVFVDWEDLKDHQDFVNSDVFGSMSIDLAHAASFEHGPPLITHTNFTSDAAAARNAPITSVRSFKLPANASDEQKAALEDAFLGVAAYCINETPCTGYACGWGLEPLPLPLPHDAAPAPGASGPGQAISFNTIFGWLSKEDCDGLKDDLEFAEAMKPLLQIALPGRDKREGERGGEGGGGRDFFHLALHGFGDE